jgi:hypothetical protein
MIKKYSGDTDICKLADNIKTEFKELDYIWEIAELN